MVSFRPESKGNSQRGTKATQRLLTPTETFIDSSALVKNKQNSGKPLFSPPDLEPACSPKTQRMQTRPLFFSLV